MGLEAGFPPPAPVTRIPSSGDVLGVWGHLVSPTSAAEGKGRPVSRGGVHRGTNMGAGGLGCLVPALHPRLPLQVFQRREDGSVNFFRGWEAYRDGFGKLTGEHWLGERPCRPAGWPALPLCTPDGVLGEWALPRWMDVCLCLPCPSQLRCCIKRGSVHSE